MITTEFLSGLDRFNLIIKKRVTSQYSGKRSSVAKGRGSILKDHRLYSWGDDFRLIDWKIYGRTDHLYIKQYEEERNLAVHVIVDCSASMNYGNPRKFDYAAMIGVGFAYLALKDNEKFQFATFADNIEFFPSRRGAAHLLTMVDHLNKISTKGNSRLSESVAQYRKVISSRSLIIIVSDFLYDIDDIKEVLVMLGGHDIKFVQVLDPGERRLSMTGDVKLEDSESHAMMRTFITPRLKASYEKDMDAHIHALEQAATEARAEFYTFTTDTPIFDAFYELLS